LFSVKFCIELFYFIFLESCVSITEEMFDAEEPIYTYLWSYSWG